VSTPDTTTQALAPVVKQSIAFGNSGVQLATMEDAYRFATAIIKSGFAPKGYDSPESVLIAIQMGSEVGLAPMQALQSIAVINGRPSIWGDAGMALVRRSGLLESDSDSIEGEGDARVVTVTVRRKNGPEVVRKFGVKDAKQSGLWGKAGPWSQYPDRMLFNRARAFALRDAFGDVLKGLHVGEESRDLEPINVTPKRSKLDAEVIQ
jgi:hypothetical protein